MQKCAVQNTLKKHCHKELQICILQAKQLQLHLVSQYKMVHVHVNISSVKYRDRKNYREMSGNLVKCYLSFYKLKKPFTRIAGDWHFL